MKSYLLTEKIKVKPTKVVGIAYVAPWQDGSLGWAVPNFIHHKQIEQPYIERYKYAEGEWAYRCKITIQLLPDKLGRVRRLRIK